MFSFGTKTESSAYCPSFKCSCSFILPKDHDSDEIDIITVNIWVALNDETMLYIGRNIRHNLTIFCPVGITIGIAPVGFGHTRTDPHHSAPQAQVMQMKAPLVELKSTTKLCDYIVGEFDLNTKQHTKPTGYEIHLFSMYIHRSMAEEHEVRIITNIDIPPVTRSELMTETTGTNESHQFTIITNGKLNFGKSNIIKFHFWKMISPLHQRILDICILTCLNLNHILQQTPILIDKTNKIVMISPRETLIHQYLSRTHNVKSYFHNYHNRKRLKSRPSVTVLTHMPKLKNSRFCSGDIFNCMWVLLI